MGGQVQGLPPSMPCRCGGVLIVPEVQRNRESKDLPAGRESSARARRAAGGRVGVRPGSARPRRLRGKFSTLREGWRPGREQPRCSWAGPGRLQKALERSRGPEAGKGAPLLGGVSAGGGGRSGGGLMAKCRQVRRRNRALRPSYGALWSSDPARCVRLPGRPGGWLGEGGTHSCLDPGVQHSQSHTLRAAGSVQNWPTQ